MINRLPSATRQSRALSEWRLKPVVTNSAVAGPNSGFVESLTVPPARAHQSRDNSSSHPVATVPPERLRWKQGNVRHLAGASSDRNAHTQSSTPGLI
jgi:hypothetical protein